MVSRSKYIDAFNVLFVGFIAPVYKWMLGTLTTSANKNSPQPKEVRLLNPRSQTALLTCHHHRFSTDSGRAAYNFANLGKRRIESEQAVIFRRNYIFPDNSCVKATIVGCIVQAQINKYPEQEDEG